MEIVGGEDKRQGGVEKMTSKTEQEYREFLDAIEEFFEWAGQENDVDRVNLEVRENVPIFVAVET